MTVDVAEVMRVAVEVKIAVVVPEEEIEVVTEVVGDEF